MKDEDVSKAMGDIMILSATHNKEIQRLQKVFEEADQFCLKDVRLLEHLCEREFLESITGLEICRICKFGLKVVFGAPVANIVQDLVDEYEGNMPDHKREKEKADRFKKEKEGFRASFGENPIRQTLRSRQDEARPKSDLPAFNITSKAPFVKTPHILRPPNKKMSIKDLNGLSNKSDVLNSNSMKEPSEPTPLRESSVRGKQKPSNQEPAKERFHSEGPSHSRVPDPMEILWKQANIRVNSIRDQRLKELDSNHTLFEKKTRDLVQKVIHCKCWIPVTFLVRLTFEQIEKNFPLENYLESASLSSSELTGYLDELKVAVECSKWLFSRPQYALMIEGSPRRWSNSKTRSSTSTEARKGTWPTSKPRTSTIGWE